MSHLNIPLICIGLFIGLFCLGMNRLALRWADEGRQALRDTASDGITKERIGAVLDISMLRFQAAMLLMLGLGTLGVLVIGVIGALVELW